MNFSEIVQRISGFSIPIFGIQWVPPESERTKARRVISYLEDRRVLYSSTELEVPRHYVEFVLEIRRFLSEQLADLSTDSELAKTLRAMRGACRKFLNAIADKDDRRIVEFANQFGHYASWEFYSAIGEMRGTFGLHIALVAGSFGLDVEDELARILPDVDVDKDELTQLKL